MTLLSRQVPPALLILAAAGAAAPAAAATLAARSCAQDAVLTAIGQAAAGDTVTVPAGRCAWSGLTLPNSKKIILQGAGQDATLIDGGLDFGKSGSRVTGFGFSGATLLSNGYGFRLDHCRVTLPAWGDAVSVLARNEPEAPVAFGLVDHNHIVNSRILAGGTNYMLTEGKQQHVLWANDPDFGGPNAVYVEDNIFTLTIKPGQANAVDGNYGGRVVFRYNSLIGGPIVEMHSSQEGGNRAMRTWEVYGNLIDNNSATPVYYPFRIRGGSGFVYFNRVTGNWTQLGVALDNVRSYAAAALGGGLCNGGSPWDGNQDASGYPCRDQIGRGKDSPPWNLNPVGAYTQVLTPAYLWANKSAGNGELPVDVINGSQAHIKPNRDFYAASPNFNGSSGVGCGTLTARPANCAVGAGYWATSQSCSNLAGLTGASHTGAIDGTLYTCTAPNTWTVRYKPYAYPHPLQAGSQTKLAPPGKLRLR